MLLVLVFLFVLVAQIFLFGIASLMSYANCEPFGHKLINKFITLFLIHSCNLFYNMDHAIFSSLDISYIGKFCFTSFYFMHTNCPTIFKFNPILHSFFFFFSDHPGYLHWKIFNFYVTGIGYEFLFLYFRIFHHHYGKSKPSVVSFFKFSWSKDLIEWDIVPRIVVI